MSDVFKSMDLFMSSIENLNFKVKASLDIYDLVSENILERLSN